MSVAQQTAKLVNRGIDATVAAALAAAGYGTPKLIRAALDATLEAIPGVGAAGVSAVRVRWPVAGA